MLIVHSSQFTGGELGGYLKSPVLFAQKKMKKQLNASMNYPSANDGGSATPVCQTYSITTQTQCIYCTFGGQQGEERVGRGLLPNITHPLLSVVPFEGLCLEATTVSSLMISPFETRRVNTGSAPGRA